MGDMIRKFAWDVFNCTEFGGFIGFADSIMKENFEITGILAGSLITMGKQKWLFRSS